MGRPASWLRLVRVANLPTAGADVLAGFLFAGGAAADWMPVSGLMLVSAAVYAGGMALNDVCDAATDAIRRSERVIPSGAISRSAALRLALVLFAAGWAGAWLAADRTWLVVGGLIVCVVLYDALLKRTVIGPAAMGLCRVLNWNLGAVLAGGQLEESNVRASILIGVYVTSITMMARCEDGAGRRLWLRAGMVGLVLAAAGVAALGIASGGLVVDQTAALAMVALAVGPGLRRAALGGGPADTRRAIGLLVAGIVLMDAALVTTARGWVCGSAVAILLVPTILLRRRFAMS